MKKYKLMKHEKGKSVENQRRKAMNLRSYLLSSGYRNELFLRIAFLCNMEENMKNILIVDDAVFMRTVLKNILVKEGYNVIAEASNGIEAISKFKEHKPDIVTMDITMPEMDGIVALGEILKIDSTAKVCMVSAMGQQQVILESVKSGAKDFIVKPFTPDDVLAKMSKLSA
jgi:two-component system chemotaxis response regulator CheY